MEECIGALAATAALLIASVAFAQQEKSAPNKYQGGASVYTDLAKAPEKARAKHNPLEKDPDAIRAGQNLFEQHCSECHGNTGEGSKKAPSLRAEEVQNATPGAIFWILTNGVVRRGMPVWSKLPEPQRWQLVSFIKSLGLAHPLHLIRNHFEPRPCSHLDCSLRLTGNLADRTCGPLRRTANRTEGGCTGSSFLSLQESDRRSEK